MVTIGKMSDLIWHAANTAVAACRIILHHQPLPGMFENHNKINALVVLLAAIGVFSEGCRGKA